MGTPPACFSSPTLVFRTRQGRRPPAEVRDAARPISGVRNSDGTVPPPSARQDDGVSFSRRIYHRVRASDSWWGSTASLTALVPNLRSRGGCVMPRGGSSRPPSPGDGTPHPTEGPSRRVRTRGRRAGRGGSPTPLGPISGAAIFSARSSCRRGARPAPRRVTKWLPCPGYGIACPRTLPSWGGSGRSSAEGAPSL